LDGLNLEPYAVVQSWYLPDADGQWESILGEYLQRIAQDCIAEGKCVIGHIKAISTFSEHHHLQISVIAADRPANIEGRVPENCTRLELTLNVLVYGLKQTTIEKVTHDIASEISSQRNGSVTHKKIGKSERHSHKNN